MAILINDPWSTEGHHFADTVHDPDRPELSKLLGPDGRPLRYQRPRRIGFDLRPRNAASPSEASP